MGQQLFLCKPLFFYTQLPLVLLSSSFHTLLRCGQTFADHAGPFSCRTESASSSDTFWYGLKSHVISSSYTIPELHEAYGCEKAYVPVGIRNGVKPRDPGTGLKVGT